MAHGQTGCHDSCCGGGSSGVSVLCACQRAARAAKKETKLMYKEEVLRAQHRHAVPAPSVIPLP